MIKHSKGRRILVTGGAGFIGSHLCEALLKSGYGVVSIDNFCDYYSPLLKEQNIRSIEATSDALAGNFRNINADIRDRGSLSKIFGENDFDAVVHLAAMTGVRTSVKNPELYEDVNMEGTRNILDALVGSGVKKFVFASSSSVYGMSKEIPFRESQKEYAALSPYARTKREGELLCQNYSSKHGINMALLRLFTVYGPRQRPDMAISTFARCSSLNEPVPLFGDGTTKRDYTYVEDIVDGVIGSIGWLDELKGEGLTETFNLASGRMVELNDLVKSMEKSLGKRMILERLDAPSVEMPLTLGDVTKSKEFFGYFPKMAIDEGIKVFVDWFRRNHAR